MNVKVYNMYDFIKNLSIGKSFWFIDLCKKMIQMIILDEILKRLSKLMIF